MKKFFPIYLSLIVIFLPSLFFWRLLIPSEVDQRTIIAGDFTEQYYPWRQFSAQEWTSWRVPLWTPALFGGQPALADIQSGALYPPHLIQAFILRQFGYWFPIWALEWQMIFHFSIAGLGAYILGCYWAGQAKGARINDPPGPAKGVFPMSGGAKRVSFFPTKGTIDPTINSMGLVFSLTFTYSGYLTGFPVQQVTILQVSAWLPWLVWLLSRCLDEIEQGHPLFITLATAAWAALVFAFAILAGHPQTVMYLTYLSFAYTIFRIVNRPNAITKSSPSALRYPLFMAIHWGLIILLGICLTTAQLWPTLEFIQQSLRQDLSFEAVSQGLPLTEVMALLYPGYFGGSPSYLGIFPMVLIGLALLLGRTNRYIKSRIYFWFSVGSLSFMLAFGANTFLYPLFYIILPGFDAIRQQERIFLLYSFASAVLAGYGSLCLSQAMNKTQRPQWQRFQQGLVQIGWIALGLTLIFMFGAVSATERGEQVNLFNGVLRHHLFNLIIFSGVYWLIQLRPYRLWRRWGGLALVTTWLAFSLFSVNWQFNLAPAAQKAAFASEGTTRFLLEHIAALDEPVRISSQGYLSGGHNAASVHHLEDITGNTPLQIAAVAQFIKQIPAWRLWQLFNVRYVVDERDIAGPGLALRYEDAGLKVYEMGDPLPRARLVYDLILGNDFQILGQDAVDLKKTALIPPHVSLSLGPPDPQASVQIISPQADSLKIAVTTQTPALLVISQIFYPGWIARLDGQPVALYQTNGIFQGVFVPAGQHEVMLDFQPRSWLWGRWISVAGVIITLGLVLWPTSPRPHWDRVRRLLRYSLSRK